MKARLSQRQRDKQRAVLMAGVAEAKRVMDWQDRTILRLRIACGVLAVAAIGLLLAEVVR